MVWHRGIVETGCAFGMPKEDDTEPVAGETAYFGAESTGVFCDVFRSAAGAVIMHGKGCGIRCAVDFEEKFYLEVHDIDFGWNVS